MNYFYSKNKQEKLGKLVEHDLFPLLIDYMYQHQNEDIILRELKAVFLLVKKKLIFVS